MTPPSERIFRPSFVRLVCVQPLAGIAICTFFLLPKFLVTELRATPFDVGVVSAAFGLAGALAVPILGAALDRFSPRRLVLASCWVLAISAIGFVWVDRIGALVIALRVAQGLAWAALFTAGMVLTIDISPPSRLAQAIGYYGVANLAMNAVAPAIGEIIAERAGWKPVFAFAAVTGVLAWLVGRGLPEERPKAAKAVDIWSILARPRTIAMVTVVSIWGAAFGAMFIFHQPFALSLGMTKVRGFFIAYTATAMFARVGIGNAVDRIGRYAVSVASFTLYCAVVFAMQWLRPGWLEAFGAALGLAHGLFFPAYSALIVERAGREEQGKLMALSNAAYNVGLAVSSLVLGGIAERSGFPDAFRWAGGATLFGLALLSLTARPKVHSLPCPNLSSSREP
jgi:MFS family permease